MQKRIGNSITIFFMFHKTPQQVLAKYESHFGTGFVSTTIEINMLAKLNNMLNLLKQSGEWLNKTLPNLLGITKQWWHFVGLQ